MKVLIESITNNIIKTSTPERVSYIVEDSLVHYVVLIGRVKLEGELLFPHSVQNKSMNEIKDMILKEIRAE